MYFQILDHKEHCIGIYSDDKLWFGELPSSPLSRTWGYHPEFDAELASIYAAGKTILEVAPSHLRAPWEKLKKKQTAFLNSFVSSGVDLNEHCFYDLVPESFLEEYNYYKTEITKHVFDTFPRPKNYEFLADMLKLMDTISKQPLKFNGPKMRSLRVKTKKPYNNFIDYRLFGAVTGRLTTTSESFPILNLKKEYRDVMLPQNDFFLELDVNAADIRSFLALLGKEQPAIDIHEWNIEHVFSDPTMTRAEAKVRFFAWFYNPYSVDHVLEKVYNRKEAGTDFYVDGVVQNPYGTDIETDDYHSLNYLIQSTSNDIVLRNVLKIDKLLQSCKSYVSFMIHDSVVIDLHKEDIPLVKSIRAAFSKTDYGDFLVSCNVGTDFGNLERIDVK